MPWTMSDRSPDSNLILLFHPRVLFIFSSLIFSSIFTPVNLVYDKSMNPYELHICMVGVG